MAKHEIQAHTILDRAEFSGGELCLHMALGGRAEVYRAGHCHPLTEDGYLLQNVGTAHHLRVHEGRVLTICLPTPIVQSQTFEECLTPHDLGVHQSVARLIDALRDGSGQLQAVELVAALVYARDASSQRFFLAPIETKDERAQQMRIAREFVLSRLANPFGVGDVAERCHYSNFHFHRLFAQWHRMTPGQYIITERIRRACRRLVLTPDPVQAIAAGCGFSSPSSFVASFRSITGLSPREFRARNFLHRQALRLFVTS